LTHLEQSEPCGRQLQLRVQCMQAYDEDNHKELYPLDGNDVLVISLV
jgi:hypothetical protein